MMEPSDSSGAAAQARRESEQALQAVRSRAPRVNRVTGALRDLLERNHFGEAIEASMRVKGQR